MHARHRSPGNGYRSNPMGIGGGGVAAGGPSYRNFNRGGFGRGQPKIFQPPQPQAPHPPRRGADVFMEAGRLATDYLVSKGLLPPNVLNGKWQIGHLKHQVDGDGVPDVVSGNGGGRRRFPEDFGNAIGSRDGLRGRRRMGSFKNPGPELNREINRSASWSERVRTPSDKQGDDDAVSGHLGEQPSEKDRVSEDQKSTTGNLESKSYDAGNMDTSIEKNQNQSPLDDVAVREQNSSVVEKDLSPEAGVVSTERSDRSKEVMDGNNDGESEGGTVTADTPMEDNAEEDHENPANKGGSDLLTLIRSNKVPTRTRSSLTIKGSKIDPVLVAEEENTNESQHSGESGDPLKHVSLDVSMGDGTQSLNPQLGISEAPSAEGITQLDLKYKVGQEPCMRSQSFAGRSSNTEEELGGAQLGYSRCSSSAVLDRGEKRPLFMESGEGTKKPRDWAPLNAQSDSNLHLPNSRGDQQSSQDGIGRSSHEDVTTQPCNEHAEEKQLFPGSFKICDLNLMEVSDVNDNHDANAVSTFPPIGQPKQEVSVDIDLSMNSNCNVTDRRNRRTDGKEVEVIDLESDSLQDNKVFNNQEQRDETIFTDLDSFPDSVQRVNESPQDGYGLMISELLEADIPSCSTVSTGVNSMHNEMGLQNEEGILGDDESIYMSLEEIPISFVPVWDQQPTRGYDKPF